MEKYGSICIQTIGYWILAIGYLLIPACTCAPEASSKIIISKIRIDKYPSSKNSLDPLDRRIIRSQIKTTLDKMDNWKLDPSNEAGDSLILKFIGSSKTHAKLSMLIKKRDDGSIEDAAVFEIKNDELSDLDVIQSRISEGLTSLQMSYNHRMAGLDMHRLCEDLKGQDQKLALRALAAITKSGDERALDCVIQFSEDKPEDLRIQAILAVRQMGTDRADSWLFMLANGHPNEKVRIAAQGAMKKEG